jgi:hypothetical protein
MSTKSKNSKGTPVISRSPSKAVLSAENLVSGTINSAIERTLNKEGEEVCR